MKLMTSSGATKSGKTRRTRSRNAILLSATQLLMDNSPDTVTVEDIAEAAGVSPRTVFNHFETRHDLIAAIAYERAAFLAAAIDAYEGASASGLLGTIGRQSAAYAQLTGPHYREFVAVLTRHNITTALVRTGVLAAALHAFADRVSESNESGVPSAVLGDLLCGVLVVAVANLAADPEFDFAKALVEAGESIDALRTGEFARAADSPS